MIDTLFENQFVDLNLNSNQNNLNLTQNKHFENFDIENSNISHIQFISLFDSQDKNIKIAKLKRKNKTQ